MSTRTPSSTKETYTLTFGDRIENHAKMQIIGDLSKRGISVKEMEGIKGYFEKFGLICEMIDLKDLLKGKDVDLDQVDDAKLLIVRCGLDLLLRDPKDNFLIDVDLEDVENIYDELIEIGECNNSMVRDMYHEQQSLEKDKKAFMYGRVVNKKARHNLCFADFSQQSDFENKKGTIVDFKDLPLLSIVRENLSNILSLFTGKDICDTKLMCEGNYYYDIRSTFIGWHGDFERRIVVGIRLGAPFPLYYRWFKDNKPVSERLKLMLKESDVYFMSSKAVGFDWKKKSIYTLRHAAGFNIKD
jgi:hypothetical protein